MERCQQQKYIVFTDNFYTSPDLADDLHQRGIELMGTSRTNRTGVPAELKDTKSFDRADRGDARYVREEHKVFVQWKDRRVVSML